MVGLLGGVILVLTTSLWVAHNSQRYDWQHWSHPTRPAWHCAADSSTTWFIACLTLWPVFFPGYFLDRPYAPRRDS